MSAGDKDDVLDLAQGAVLAPSEEVDEDSVVIKGYDFNQGVQWDLLFDSYFTTGFQATNLGKCIETIRKMIEARRRPCTMIESTFPYPEQRTKTGCTIFLGYTSNLVTSGLRDVFRFLTQHNMVDCIVTSAGGVEEDFIKCLKPTLLGNFQMNGAELRKKGLNRAGNLLIPNSNYCEFESWLTPILDRMSKQQDQVNWTPSKLGLEINHEESIYYWAAKNNIPVFCPALTDGSLGDMIYFFNVRAEKPLKVDIAEDVAHINTMAVKSQSTGVIILGGGVVKHHINNANLMRNGSDYAVYINTGNEFDGSDSGASPDEAVSWGKVRHGIDPVKVCADATLVFPIVVATTFAKERT